MIALGALAGQLLCRRGAAAAGGSLGIPVSRRVGRAALAAYVIGLLVLPFWAALSPSTGLFNAFYRSGALVFGGGHVVLPLLSDALVSPGWVSEQAFLQGYGAAQAVPGPVFTFAAYLGAVAAPSPNRIAGSCLGLLGIFLPGMLVLLGALPFWDAFRRRAGAGASMRGVNAAMVGLLGATLYNPLWTSSVASPGDVALVLAGFILLIAWRAPPIVVVVLGAAAGLCIRLYP